MLALTLKHPWAYAIAHCGKRIENRSWKPRFSSLSKGDWFCIHGGRKPTGAAIIDMMAEVEGIAEFLTPEGEQPDWHPILGLDLDILAPEGIVAVCKYDGFVTKSDDPWFGGPIGWLLTDVWALPEPVPCRGAQGLWSLPDDVYRAVREQYGQALQVEREQKELFAR